MSDATPDAPVVVPELWTAAEDSALRALRTALRGEDLIGALCAIEQASPEATSVCRGTLEAWGAQVRVAGPSDAAAAAAELRRVLVEELGFAGDREDYYNPRNSFLSLVLHRRRGLPILLGVVWIVVGRGAGLEVDGVGMPGHFLVRVGGAEGVVVDPFAGGAQLDDARIQALFRSVTGGHIAWQDTFMEATPAPRVIERVLWNLVNAYNRVGDPVRFYRYARIMATLLPDRGHLQMMHATAAEAVGAVPLAAELFRDVASRFAHTSIGRLADKRASRLARTTAWVN